MMKNVLTLASLASLATLASAASGKDYSMGPAALLFPTDREWSEDSETTGPCGTSASPGYRTKFPLSGGSLAFVAQDTFFETKISISLNENPASNDDFSALLEDSSLAEMHPGHTCLTAPAADGDAKVGTNATIQVTYKSGPKNETYYICADIVFAEEDEVSTRIPCFNATTPGTAAVVVSSNSSDSGSEETPAPTSTADAGSGGQSVRGMSSDAIAAIAVLAAAAGFAL